ncbi:zinc finger TRAF-type-containing protein 1 [Phascolarctos cinereus]|uniref:Zinc finger TRAF-type-containing protein 1 n=1 Tax=Phascolarctos cinereus TaxID=38626 RepID=A0A6P5L690_PHACI|nr:cysteine and histidine-rich protein 1 [Phascolarctos cinereus]
MSGAEEAGGPAAAAGGPAGSGAGPQGASAMAVSVLGEAAGPGLPDEAGLPAGRQLPLPEAGGDPDAPPKKRLRAAEAEAAAAAAASAATASASASAGSGKLEERLYSVLCCTVCLDLPKASVYQCTNGHLMCAGCFIHLLADARLKEEQATCPNCRCEISKSLCCRNLAVEKAVSELPSECGFCMRQFPRSLLERHQKEECQDRVTQCKYKRIGCPWQGPFHELTVHEAECTHPTKTGNELMEILDEMDQTHKKEMQLYNSIFSLLSFEKIGYTEVQFRPYRTDDFITRLYYETPRFTVLSQTWVLKARVNDSERNPNLSCKRTLSFQLILKSKISSPMECSFLLLKGPYDDVKINPVIYHFVFTNENNETDYVPLPIIDSVECNKLLAAKNINLRLFIFQIQK